MQGCYAAGKQAYSGNMHDLDIAALVFALPLTAQ